MRTKKRIEYSTMNHIL